MEAVLAARPRQGDDGAQLLEEVVRGDRGDAVRADADPKARDRLLGTLGQITDTGRRGVGCGPE